MDFTPTQDMISAAEAVLIAMAYTETLRPIVIEYKKKILETCQFEIAEKWTESGRREKEVITNPDHAYLLNESDFAFYLTEVHLARDEAGLKVSNPEHCPLLVAEKIQVDTENLLIKAMEPITGIKRDDLYNLDDRKTMLDLSLKLLAPFVTDDLKKTFLYKQEV